MTPQLVNDCGPLFSRAFYYDAEAITSISFKWPANDNDDQYYMLYQKADVKREHHDRIKIKYSIDYTDFFEIIENFTPRIVFIFSHINVNVKELPTRDSLNQATLNALENVTTIIHGGNDIQPLLLTRFLPNIEFLYVFQFMDSSNDKNEDIIKLPKLRTLSCWHGNLKTINRIRSDYLNNLDIYTRLDTETTKLQLGEISKRKFNILRIEASIEIDDANNLVPTGMKILQFFPTKGNKEQIQHPKQIIKCLEHAVPQDLLLPPNVLTTEQEITTLCHRMIDRYDADHCALGVYITDKLIKYYIDKFQDIQIFDPNLPLHSACLRTSKRPEKMIPKDIDDDILKNVFKNEEGEKKYLLTNFNIFDKKKTKQQLDWLNLFLKILNDRVYICSHELLIENEDGWPTIPKNTKNRMMIFNRNTESIYLDINRKPLFVIAEQLKEIYTNIPFKNVHIVMRSNETDTNSKKEFEELLKKELGLENKINVFQYDMPAKIIVR